MDVSIVLVSYNTKDLTKDCLNSIYRFTEGIEFEVFVVDNNSHDGSAQMIEQEFQQVRLIRNSDNKGFGAANNIAIRESNAKYIFCLNTDTVLLNNSIKEFYDFMEKEENKNIGACGCQLLDKNMKLQHSYGYFPNIQKIVASNLFLARIFPTWYKKHFTYSPNENSKNPYQVEYITGADLFIRKSVLDKIGFFDENFFMYFEESELQHRMLKNNFISVIIPTINIIHLCGLPSKNPSVEKLKMYRESELYYFEKIGGKKVRQFVKILYIIRFIFNIKFDKSYIDKLKMHINI